MKTQLILLILLATLLQGCMRSDPLRSMVGSYRNYTDVNARIDKGVLHDPHGRFSIKVPQLVQPGAVIRGRLDKQGGTVQFSDDFGKLIRIDVSTAIDPTSLAMLRTPDWRDALSLNRSFMHELNRAAVPQAKLIHQEYLDLNGTNLDFYVLTMPEGSTLADAKTRKRHDALRASVSLIQGDSFFTITTQHILPEGTDILGMWRQDENQTEIIARMKKTLLETLETVTF